MQFTSALLLVGSATAFTSTNNKVAQRTQTVQLSLWGEPTKKDGENGDMSQSLPFAPRPKLLDGTMAGDVGFE